jgi:L-iditol 2-dehydrogenase
MKAVRVEADGSIAAVDLPEPEIGPGEALLETRVSGICGSDLLDWYVRRKAGTVLGHEVAGVIRAVGPGAAGFRVGDRVAPHHHAPCLACEACAAGRYVHCAEWRRSRLEPGGMAELVKIPAGNLARDTLKIPDAVSDEEASFVEPLATVVKALRRARFSRGQSLLVVGLGPAGQLAIRLARALGASTIAGADRVASRLALAEGESEADAVIDVSRKALGAAARQVAPQGFDVVFVCPGKRDVVAEAFAAAAPGGTLLLFTMAPPGEVWPADLFELYFREVTVLPSYSCGPDDTREALERISRREVRVTDLVSHRYPVARAADAFERARSLEGVMKVAITF